MRINKKSGGLLIAIYCCPFSKVLQPVTLACMIDLLPISVNSYGNFKSEILVSADARITFPLTGEDGAGGKSRVELKEAIAMYLIYGGFISYSRASATVLKHLSKQVSVMGSISEPEDYPWGYDSSKADLIFIAGSGHSRLVALMLLLVSAAPFFLLYFFLVPSSMSRQAVIAISIGYRALAASRSNTSHAFKKSEYDYSNSVSYA